MSISATETEKTELVSGDEIYSHNHKVVDTGELFNRNTVDEQKLSEEKSATAKEVSIDSVEQKNDKDETESPPPPEKSNSSTPEKVLSPELTVADVGKDFDEYFLEFPNTGYSFLERDGKIDLEKNGRFVGLDIEAFMDASGYYAAVSKASNEGRGVWKSFNEESQTMYVAIITRKENEVVTWNTYAREIKKVEESEDKEEIDNHIQTEKDAQQELLDTPPQTSNEDKQSPEYTTASPKNIAEFFFGLKFREEKNLSTAGASLITEVSTAATNQQQAAESISLGLEIATVDNLDTTTLEDVPPIITEETVREVHTESIEEPTITPEHSAFQEVLAIDIQTETEKSIDIVEINPITESPVVDIETLVATTAVVETIVETPDKSKIDTVQPIEDTVETQQHTIPEITLEATSENNAKAVEQETVVVKQENIVESDEKTAQIDSKQGQQTNFIEQSQAGANEVFDHLYEQAQRLATIFNEQHQVQSEDAKDLLNEVVNDLVPADGFYGQQATEQRETARLAAQPEIEDFDLPIESSSSVEIVTERSTDSNTSSDKTAGTNKPEAHTSNLLIEDSSDKISAFDGTGSGPTPPHNSEGIGDISDEKSTTIESQQPGIIDNIDRKNDLDTQSLSPETPPTDDGPEVTHIIEQPVEPLAQSTEVPIEQIHTQIEFNIEPIVEQTLEPAIIKEAGSAQEIPSIVEQQISKDVEYQVTEHDSIENIEVTPLSAFQEFNQRAAETTGISLVELPITSQSGNETTTEVNSLNTQNMRHGIAVIQQSNTSTPIEPSTTASAPTSITMNQSI